MKNIFFYIFLLFAAATLLPAIRTLRSRAYRSKLLASCMFTSFGVTLSYAVCLAAQTYWGFSVATSLYFVFIDFTTILLLFYIYAFVNNHEKLQLKAFHLVITILGVADSVIMLINPSTEIAISYQAADVVAGYVYLRKPLYNVHLGFNYLIIALIFFLMLRKMITMSRLYRRKYINTLIGLLVVVLLNGVFLYAGTNVPDISVLLYGALAIFFYYNDFYYSNRVLAKRSQSMVLDDMGHPLILFDSENRISMVNRQARPLIADKLNSDFSLPQFLELYDLDTSLAESMTDTFFHIDTHDDAHYRCDLHVLLDEKKALVGRLLVMMDRSLELDPLTRFPTQNVMRNYFSKEENKQKQPIAVIACEVDNIASINNQCGRSNGDRSISILAGILREMSPRNAFFVRMEDAVLIAICPNMDIFAARRLSGTISDRAAAIDYLPFHLSVQCSISIVPDDEKEVYLAAEIARSGLKTRRILRSDSYHASLLASLAQTQAETDSEVSAHVQRTSRMCELLGNRLGLSDHMINDLSMLCLLHDIGKLGIPLEIQNKPDRLTFEEWEVMRSHVEKGHRIAAASDGLRGIADMILHHHECWDGSGYPDGLKGVSIPLLSRILAVVDTYDAMTNDRPYRKALSRSMALHELQKCAGSQFDPSIVSEFSQMLAELFGDDMSPQGSEIELVSKPLGVAGRIQMNEQLNIVPVNYSRYTLDAENYILAIDDEFTRLTGYTETDVAQYHLNQRDLIFKADQTDYSLLVNQQLDKSNFCYLEHRLRRKDGSSRDVMCFGRVYYDPISREMRSEIIFADVRETRTSQQLMDIARETTRRSLSRMESVLRKDPLTGLLTHDAFQSDVNLVLLKNEHRVMFLMVDVDNFKKCNDSWGHAMGDEVLIRVADSLQNIVGENGICGRLGGDEFAAIVCFPPNATVDQLRLRAEAIHRGISEAMAKGMHPVTISVGAYSGNESETTFLSLYKAADRMMYNSKGAGKNTLTCSFPF